MSISPTSAVHGSLQVLQEMQTKHRQGHHGPRERDKDLKLALSILPALARHGQAVESGQVLLPIYTEDRDASLRFAAAVDCTVAPDPASIPYLVEEEEGLILVHPEVGTAMALTLGALDLRARSQTGMVRLDFEHGEEYGPKVKVTDFLQGLLKHGYIDGFCVPKVSEANPISRPSCCQPILSFLLLYDNPVPPTAAVCLCLSVSLSVLASVPVRWVKQTPSAAPRDASPSFLSYCYSTNPPHPPPLFVCLSFSVCLSLCLSACLSVCLPLSLSLSLPPPPPPPLSLPLYVCLSMSRVSVFSFTLFLLLALSQKRADACKQHTLLYCYNNNDSDLRRYHHRHKVISDKRSPQPF